MVRIVLGRALRKVIVRQKFIVTSVTGIRSSILFKNDPPIDPHLDKKGKQAL